MTFGRPVRVNAVDGDARLNGEQPPRLGPAVAIASRTVIHVTWPTLVSDGKSGEPTIAIFYASSTDGVTFTPRARRGRGCRPRRLRTIRRSRSIRVANR